MVFRFFAKSDFRNDAPQQLETPLDAPFTPSPILLQKIQGFQTITTYLGQIQRQAPIKSVDFLENSNETHDHRKEIRLCDAFAHLAVFEHDVIALATDRTSNEIQTQLRILACASASPEKDEDTPPSDGPKPPGTFSGLRNLRFCCTRNPRKDESKSSPEATHPTIIEAKAPVGYSEEPNMGRRQLHQYLDGLEKDW